MKDNKSHFHESVKNLSVLVFSQVFNLLLGLISRSVFIYRLGNYYLGIGGLYTSVLMILNLTELGVGESLVYSYIKTFAQKDYTNAGAIFRYSKKIFFYISCCVGGLSLAIAPILPLFVKDSTAINGFYLYYMIYVVNIILSYMIGPYSAVYQADQKIRINRIITLFATIVSNVLQIVSLLVFSSYSIYLLLMLLTNIISYLLYALKFHRDYPELRKGTENEQQEKELRKLIFKRVRDTFIMNVSGAIMESIDNLTISRFVGLNTVGMYSNYLTITTNLRTLTKSIYYSISSSIGDINHKNERKVIYKYFKAELLLFHLLGTFVIVGIYVLIEELISLWIGINNLLPSTIVPVICFDLYINIILYALANYINTTFVLQKAKYGFILTAISNLVLSIVLGNKLGLFGILLATPISRLLFCYTISIKELYTELFKETLIKGITLSVIYIGQAAIICILTKVVLIQIIVDSWRKLFLKGILTISFSFLIMVVLNLKNESMWFYYKFFSSKIIKYIRDNGRKTNGR